MDPTGSPVSASPYKTTGLAIAFWPDLPPLAAAFSSEMTACLPQSS